MFGTYVDPIFYWLFAGAAIAIPLAAWKLFDIISWMVQ